MAMSLIYAASGLFYAIIEDGTDTRCFRARYLIHVLRKIKYR